MAESNQEIDIVPDEPGDGSEELYERMNLVVDKGQEPIRIDKFLVARIEHASRNKVQQAIESGRVLINGKQVSANYKIKPGEEIIVYSDKEVQGEEIIPENLPLNIVYEDDEISRFACAKSITVQWHLGCCNEEARAGSVHGNAL